MHSSWRYYLRRVSGMPDIEWYRVLNRKTRLSQMVEKTFDNRFRQGKCHFELAGTNPVAAGMFGAKFEKVTLDEEIGPEVVVRLTDLTPFAHELKRERFELRLKAGAAQSKVRPVLFILWWIPPVTNGTPFGLYEQILNPAHTGVLEILRQIARQTHLHLIPVAPGQELLDVYEFENIWTRKANFDFRERVHKIWHHEFHRCQAGIRPYLQTDGAIQHERTRSGMIYVTGAALKV
jgi:hypothetical protein